MGETRVLIVDDDPALRRLLKAALQSFGVCVTMAANGREALEGLARTAPDAIVLDLEMPVMDGRSFFRELRDRGDKTPVIVLSAFGAKRGYQELGAEAFMEKPFEPEELVIALAELIEAAESGVAK
jgi:two-component system response regulator MprA